MRRAVRRAGPRTKYGAVRTTVDNIRFHSAKEARRYQELKLLEAGGAIRHLELQPVFRLCVASLVNGATAGDVGTHDVGAYIGDFAYEETTRYGGWFKVIEDVKGVKTPLYKWKKKHVEAQYGIQIRET